MRPHNVIVNQAMWTLDYMVLQQDVLLSYDSNFFPCHGLKTDMDMNVIIKLKHQPYKGETSR